MIKEALMYIVGLKEAKIYDINEDKFTDKDLKRLDKSIRADSITMSTLTSLLDYIKSDTDSMAQKMIVHVLAPDKVQLISMLDADREREVLVSVQANLPKIRLNEFINQEEFIIMMQAQFVSDEERKVVTAFAGNVEDRTIANYGDDGVTQKATVKTGLASKEEFEVPNPVTLAPYRTFQEVQQIPSEFVFRMKSTDRGVSCALFEADGGAWRNAAVEAVAEFLKNQLADMGGSQTEYTVIA
ncbi:hypothetical protein QA584_17405 [Anaerocolumna sp. AGMB13025]|uniref:hypothetical protein n=1 Tax=Anaerocolumna sp. AGMB13025 TaxID=3039116 RepID=UPI00241EEC6B|nr:hypothetical protein [Anaerocolumna sp. AGMB13025]WFR55378.1 hypothetical protein QA584_17405 [Anaerocolumna sp. AGMB13025]